MTREEVIGFLNSKTWNPSTLQNFFVKFLIFKGKSLPIALIFVNKVFNHKDLKKLLPYMFFTVIVEFHINQIHYNGQLVRYY